MNVFVGPVAPDCVLAWTEWAHAVLDDLRNDPRTGACLSAGVLDDIEGYVAEWERITGRSDDAFRWQGEVHPDHLEYFTNALYNLDVHLAADGQPGTAMALPPEGRQFHLVLVRALLTALADGSSARAAFADQMRSSWPTAAEAD